MPDSEAQTRTPKIMRFPQPHDSDGRPCPPTDHPRSQPPSPIAPTSGPPDPEIEPCDRPGGAITAAGTAGTNRLGSTSKQYEWGISRRRVGAAEAKRTRKGSR